MNTTSEGYVICSKAGPHCLGHDWIELPDGSKQRCAFANNHQIIPFPPCGSDLESPRSTSVNSGATDSAKGPQISDGEVRVTAPSGGQKGRKPARFGLIPGEALWKVAELYGKGAEKYEDRNWERGYDWSLSFDALMRHAWQFWNGEDIDAETGQPHMASVTFHALALLTFMEKHRKYDDRPSKKERDADLFRKFFGKD